VFHGPLREWRRRLRTALGTAPARGGSRKRPNERSDETAADLLYREALYLDERRWDDWLALYDEAAEFWVPAWKSEDQPTDDPSSEVSLVYAARRSELEDRVWRVRSGQSIASTPLPRTAHIVTNVLDGPTPAARSKPARSGPSMSSM